MPGVNDVHITMLLTLLWILRSIHRVVLHTFLNRGSVDSLHSGMCIPPTELRGHLLKGGLLARDYGICVHARGHNANLTYCAEMELAQAK